jgi:hypothetical protein
MACVGDKRLRKANAVQVSTKGYFMPDDSFRVYKKGEYRVLESHYIFDSTRIQLDSNGNVANTEFIGRSTRQRFFVYHKDSLFGYQFYRWHDGPNPERLLVDSVFYSVRVHFDYKLDSIGLMQPDSSFWNKEKTERKDVYISRATAHLPTVWWALSYSTKLRLLEESFSRKLDSARQMKLFRVEIKYDSTLDDSGRIVYYPAYLDHQIKIVRTSDSLINEFIDKYKKIISPASSTGRSTRNKD